MNSTPVLFTLTCSCPCVTLVLSCLLSSRRYFCNSILFLSFHDYIIKNESLLPIKTVRGRLPHSMFCHSHSVLTAKPIPIPSCLSFSFSLPAKPIHISIPGYHVSFSFPPPTKSIPIPTCIPRLAKIKLKKQAPRRFEPATSQINVFVATTTPHVCLCLHLL
jgi:hypothetical protein